MAKKKGILKGFGLAAAGIALSVVGPSPRQERRDEKENQNEVALACCAQADPRVLKFLGAPAPVVEAAQKEVFARERAARRAARKERKALAAARKVTPSAPVVEKTRRGPPRGYVVRRHLDGRTDFIPVRA